MFVLVLKVTENDGTQPSLSLILWSLLLVEPLRNPVNVNRGYYTRISSSRAESISHSFASLTRERYFQHEKIKFVSPSGHVRFCLFYRYWWNSYIKHYFLPIFACQKNVIKLGYKVIKEKLNKNNNALYTYIFFSKKSKFWWRREEFQMGHNENYWDLKESKGLGYLTVNEWGWVSYEELWRWRRVLSASAYGG